MIPYRILVLCTGNRCRSQMAHGWLTLLGGSKVDVRSAGTIPKGVHPKAILMMKEVGADISAHTSNHVNEYANEKFDLVLTVCDKAKESCPVYFGAAEVRHFSFEDPDHPNDPSEDLDVVFRRVRDEIRTVFGAYAAGRLDG